jgi:5'-nucleotidase
MLGFLSVFPQADSELPPAPDQQLPLPLPGLLEPPPVSFAIPRKDRVFANRNLHLTEIEWIGFDMDYTLAIYVQSEMDALSVRLTIDRLIAKGYPEFLRQLSFDTNFPIRGLLIDKERGNILKLDRHKQVAKGYHGTQLLDQATIDSLYHESKLRYQSSRYHWIDTLFAMCEVTSYAAIVTALDEKGVEFDPDKLFSDVRTSIDEAHADGSVYREVTANLARYLDRDAGLPTALHKLRSAGKKLFLLTNSPYPYTNTVMSYLLEDTSKRYVRWQTYFDLIICSAKKPRWFAEGTPFMERMQFPELDGKLHDRAGHDLRKAHSLERGHIYEGGSLAEFESLLGIFGRKVLYVGDHIYGDILRSKKDSTWRTGLVIQELDQEIAALKTTTELRVRRRQLYEARPLLEDELRYYQRLQKELFKKPDEDAEVRRSRAAAKHELDRIRTQLVELEAEYEQTTSLHDRAFHEYFGPLLKEMNGLSVFGQQVETYADIYMRRVSCLGGYPSTQFFRSPHDLLPHEI